MLKFEPSLLRLPMPHSDSSPALPFTYPPSAWGHSIFGEIFVFKIYGIWPQANKYVTNTLPRCSSTSVGLTQLINLGLYEKYQKFSSVFMSNRTVDVTGDHSWSAKLVSFRSKKAVAWVTNFLYSPSNCNISHMVLTCWFCVWRGMSTIRNSKKLCTGNR